jgi:twinkle protein
MNAAEISQQLAAHADTIAVYLLPGGKKAGAEWKAGSVGGEAGTSLSVRMNGAKAGVWKDFASGESGDLLDLWAATRGLSIAEAIAEAKQYLGVHDTMPQRQPKTYAVPSRPKTALPSVTAQWLTSRGLTPETIEAFKVREVTRGGQAWALFPYLRDGVYVNGKYRNPADKKGMQQEKDAEPCLFGWHLIDPKARTVAICEGEVDAMTLHQVGLSALSVNAGAGNHQWIENDWDRLERFSEILVCFDNDEAGDKGAAEVIKRLGLERCKRMRPGAKDANDWLQGGATPAQFLEAAKLSKSLDPDELRSAFDFMTRVKALFWPAHGAPTYPLLQLDRQFEWFEFRPGELTVWTGFNGHGKSLMLSQVQLGLMSQGARFVVFSGEMTPEYLLKRMTKQATGLDRPTMQYIDAVGDWLRDRCFIFNQTGSATLKRLLEVFAYAVKRYGVNHVVIDSLMMTDVPEDGPGAMTAQKEAIRALCDFGKRTGAHVHLVAHPRKGKDESAGPGKMDVAGSGKITDGADNVFTVWRKQKDEAVEADPDTADAKLELKKQRNGDTQNYTQWLWFDKASMQFRALKKARRSISYVQFEQDQEPADAAGPVSTKSIPPLADEEQF